MRRRWIRRRHSGQSDAEPVDPAEPHIILFMRRALAMFAVLACALPVTLMSRTQPTDKALERAKKLLRESPVIDGHNDYPMAVREKAEGDLNKLDIRASQPTIMTDIPRLIAGGVGAQFWSVYVPPPAAGQDPATAVTATLDQIDIVYRMVEKYPNTFAIALTADDVER